MRKSYLTVLKNQLQKGRLLWPIRQGLKWPGIRLGKHLGKPLTGPIHGTFFTTYACNLRCGFCDLPYRHLEYKKAGREELSLAEKLLIMDDFSRIGTTAIGFTGLEPMLDPHKSDWRTRDLFRNGFCAPKSAIRGEFTPP